MPAGGRWPGLVSGLILILSACSLEAPVENRPDATALLDRELVDVRTGEPFTLRELAEEQPVLLETMAVWCVTCLRQQREVVLAHQEADFHSVGIGIDPNEKAEDLARYADVHGFDWRFVTADAELVAMLRDAFGVASTNPPSTPTFVVTSDGIRPLPFGQFRSVRELIAELRET